MVFPMTIPPRDINQIIEVAVKYSDFMRYNKANPGKTQKKEKRNVFRIIPPTRKLLN